MARDVVMVNGLPGSGKSSQAPRLAAPLALGPVIRVDTAGTVDRRALGDQVRAALWTS